VTSGLSAPPPADQLNDFPAFTLRAEATVFRVHDRERGAWWFGSAGYGRFDLVKPRGTCYAAETPAGAFIERFGDVAAIPAGLVAAKRLAGLRLPRPFRLADATAEVALHFGVTLELSAGVRNGALYGHTQPWAEAFADAGFDGIRYRCRHDPSGSETAYALFGDAGERSWTLAQPGSTPIRQELWEHVSERFGLIVLPEA
jgi:RES domain